MCEGWQIALPFRGQGPNKTRLHLPDAEQWARRWLEIVRAAASPFGQVEVVGMEYGPGLNQGLLAWRQRHSSSRWAVILPDLPQLQSQDVESLLAACSPGSLALAPDRHEQGTNALACWQVEPELVFGEGSLARFQAQLFPHTLVRRPGLAHDVDTLEDFQSL